MGHPRPNRSLLARRVAKIEYAASQLTFFVEVFVVDLIAVLFESLMLADSNCKAGSESDVMSSLLDGE